MQEYVYIKLKKALVFFASNFNKNNKNYKITYFEINDIGYVIYYEDKNYKEYSSENYFNSDLSKCVEIDYYYNVIKRTLENSINIIMEI